MKPTLIIDGDDLVVRNVRGTCFGGTSDPQDNGETASGISTKNPSVLGVALPRKYEGSHPALQAALGDGIIPPRVPFLLPVQVKDLSTGLISSAPFIDLGPATHTGNYIDLTIAFARQFNKHATATNFEIQCDYRIIGGAKFE